MTNPTPQSNNQSVIVGDRDDLTHKLKVNADGSINVNTGGGGGAQAVNLTEVGGAAVALGAATGAASIPVALPSDQVATVASAIVPNNTTAVVVKGSAGVVYGIECFNNSATIAYLKIYNATSATAGSGTPLARFMIPAATAGGGGFIASTTMMGRVFSTGITYIVTTGIADNDTGAPAASAYIVNINYK